MQFTLQTGLIYQNDGIEIHRKILSRTKLRLFCHIVQHKRNDKQAIDG